MVFLRLCIKLSDVYLNEIGFFEMKVPFKVHFENMKKKNAAVNQYTNVQDINLLILQSSQSFKIVF